MHHSLVPLIHQAYLDYILCSMLNLSQVKATSPVSTGLSLPQIAPEAADPTLGNAQHYPQLIRISWPDSVLSRALIDLLEHFSWDQMSIFVSNDDYGTTLV